MGQAETLSTERDQQRRSQKEARIALRATESQFKAREDGVATATQRRQTLHRQAVKLKGETVGLRARIATAANEKGETAGTGAVVARSAAASKASVSGSSTADVAVAAQDEALQESRAVSLRLQREIVHLWELLRCSDEG